MKMRLAPKPIGNAHANWKPPFTKTCLACGVSFEKDGRYSYRADVMRFCSTTCWYKWIREDPTRHGSFQGGREPYYGPDWNEQAKKARERDGFTCQDCGLHQEKPLLDVHHIRPRRAFRGNWQGANDLANLVTLCKSCHKKREPKPIAHL